MVRHGLLWFVLLFLQKGRGSEIAGRHFASEALHFSPNLEYLLYVVP